MVEVIEFPERIKWIGIFFKFMYPELCIENPIKSIQIAAKCILNWMLS